MSENLIFSELWELIFDKLPTSDLLRLTVVCRTFKQIIGNSCKLMRKIVLTVNAENCCDRCLLESERCYRRIKLYGVNMVTTELDSFLCKQGGSIEELKITNSSLSLSDLAKIFRLVADGLRFLFVHDLKITGDSDHLEHELPKLRKLNIMASDDSTGMNMLNLIDGCQITEFSCFCQNEVDVEGIKSLSRFFSSLKKLESLCLAGKFTERLLNEQKLSLKHELSLQSLWIEMNGQVQNENLRKLLESQASTLQFVNLGRVEVNDTVWAIICSMRSLRSLRLDDCSFKFVHDRRLEAKIPQLFLSKINTKVNEDEICKLLRSSEVEELFLKSMTIIFQLSIEIAYEMPRLIHLTVDSCSFDPITFPSLKSLTFIASQSEDIMKMILVNRSIRELYLESKHQTDFEFERVLGKLKNASIKYFDQS